MSHHIEGIILPHKLFAEATSHPLYKGFALDAANLYFIPLTDELFDSLSGGAQGGTNAPFEKFHKVSAGVVQWLRHLSQGGRVAYVETDYFGGAGCQAAAVWERGELIYGPQQASIGPVNQALACLGLKSTGADEFETAGLSRHRCNDRWLLIEELAAPL